MKKKFLTMVDKTLDDIERLKSILESYNTIYSTIDNNEDLKELENKKSFVQEQLIYHENLYVKYKENNEPYYEVNSYGYFKKQLEFSYDKNYDFVNEVMSLIDEDIKPSEKVKILKELVKAYKEINSKE